jgi:hypothetical protein
MPTLDIDFENETKTELCKAAKRDLAKGAKPAEYENKLLDHIRRMDEMTAYLHFPRSLYSSTGHSSELRLSRRIKNQVLCLYLRESEASDQSNSAPKQSIPNNTMQQYNSSYRNDPLSPANHGLLEARPSSKQQSDPQIQPIRRSSTTQPNPQHHELAPTSSPQHEEGELMLRGIIVPQLWVLGIFIEGKE